jgi:hypothetical protein
VIVRYPARWSICCWAGLSLIAATTICGWLLLKLIPALRDEFTPGLLVPLADICLFFLISTRVLRQPASTMADRETGLDTSQLFASEPSTADIWFSGGWRTAVVLSLIWTLYFTGPFEPNPRATYICLLFALMIASAIVVPWALIPTAKALRKNASLNLLRAARRNRARFVLRNSFRRPLAALWLVVSTLLCLGLPITVFWPEVPSPELAFM